MLYYNRKALLQRKMDGKALLHRLWPNHAYAKVDQTAAEHKDKLEEKK